MRHRRSLFLIWTVKGQEVSSFSQRFVLYYFCDYYLSEVVFENMPGYKSTTLSLLVVIATAAVGTNAFVNNAPTVFGRLNTEILSAVADNSIDTRTGKPTGSSFLPEEARERAMNGNKIEKIKMEKDATSAWVDVYDYAAKIRAGELDWQDIDKGDFDNVSFTVIPYSGEIRLSPGFSFPLHL